MGAIDMFSIRRQREIARPAAGQKALGFVAAGEIDDGDVAAEPIRDIKCAAGLICN